MSDRSTGQPITLKEIALAAEDVPTGDGQPTGHQRSECVSSVNTTTGTVIPRNSIRDGFAWKTSALLDSSRPS